MKKRKNHNVGMTLPELVLAIIMLITFTGFAVMIFKYTARFFQPLNEEAKEEYISSNKELGDMLNDHTQINNAFDSIIEIFSEPGIKKDTLFKEVTNGPFKKNKTLMANWSPEIQNFKEIKKFLKFINNN